MSPRYVYLAAVGDDAAEFTARVHADRRLRTHMTNAYCEVTFCSRWWIRLDAMLAARAPLRALLRYWNAEARKRARGDDTAENVSLLRFAQRRAKGRHAPDRPVHFGSPLAPPSGDVVGHICRDGELHVSRGAEHVETIYVRHAPKDRAARGQRFLAWARVGRFGEAMLSGAGALVFTPDRSRP